MFTTRRVRLLIVLSAIIVLATGLGAADRFPGVGGDIEITPIIHSSVQVEFRGTVIQVDPWSVGDLSKAKPADLILITDDVGHHLDVKAIGTLRKPSAPIVMPSSGQKRIPDGIVLENGAKTTAAGVAIESIAAYDIKPGPPEHPKGDANGYVISIGGKRIYLAGVTECVPEVRALKNIDVAFMPMNIPVERMSPADAAACTKIIQPKVVYVYHYDQDFANELKGTSIEFKRGAWYPKK